MASLKFTLSTVPNKDTKKVEILARYRNTRKVAQRAHTRIFILPEYWIGEAVVVNKRKDTKEVLEHKSAEAKFSALKTHITEKGNNTLPDDMGPDWLQDTIDRFLFPENYAKPDKGELCFQDKTEEYLKYKKVSAERIHTYSAVFRIIKRFELYTGKEIILDKATANTLLAIEDFFRTEHTLFEPVQLKYRTGLKPVKKYKYAWDHTEHERAPRERSDNAIVGYMSAVRAYWRWCIDMGYTNNDPFRKYSVGSQKYGTPYYLTTEERDLLYKTDMGKDKDLAQARDIFIFQCYIGCRISDLFALTENNIVTTDNGISVQYVPSKTKEERPRVVKVYLAPTAIEILERYRSNKKGPIFPFYATGKLNGLIREALKKAGINRVVTIVNPRTKQSEQHPISDIASSHMARRTFIGNLYKKVKDPNLVGKLSGHCEGSKAFARYRDIDDDMIKEMTSLLD
ncbi:MAG: integrase catalytic domain-containing protein [Bacteroidales bacterium]|nr:integrase catalytic domain-containing protein [Bacteroidales bacterium]